MNVANIGKRQKIVLYLVEGPILNKSIPEFASGS
jgi:hypothetical protein